MSSVRDLIIRHCHETGVFHVSSANCVALAVCNSFRSAEQVAVHLARARRLEVWLDDTTCGQGLAPGRKIWPRDTPLRTFLCDRTPAGLRSCSPAAQPVNSGRLGA